MICKTRPLAGKAAEVPDFVPANLKEANKNPAGGGGGKRRNKEEEGGREPTLSRDMGRKNRESRRKENYWGKPQPRGVE